MAEDPEPLPHAARIRALRAALDEAERAGRLAIRLDAVAAAAARTRTGAPLPGDDLVDAIRAWGLDCGDVDRPAARARGFRAAAASLRDRAARAEVLWSELQRLLDEQRARLGDPRYAPAIAALKRLGARRTEVEQARGPLARAASQAHELLARIDAFLAAPSAAADGFCASVAPFVRQLAPDIDAVRCAEDLRRAREAVHRRLVEVSAELEALDAEAARMDEAIAALSG